MKRPPIADSIGQPYHQKNNMNPAALERLAKYSVYPVKSAGFLMRKSSYYRRDFYCLIMGRKAQTNMRIFTERNSRFLAPSVRHATTNAFGASSTAETIGLFFGASAIRRAPSIASARPRANPPAAPPGSMGAEIPAAFFVFPQYDLQASLALLSCAAPAPEAPGTPAARRAAPV